MCMEVTDVNLAILQHFSEFGTCGFFVAQLCEVDLSEMLPSQALAPFGEEIRTRQQRRRRRMQQVMSLYTPFEQVSHFVSLSLAAQVMAVDPCYAETCE